MTMREALIKALNEGDGIAYGMRFQNLPIPSDPDNGPLDFENFDVLDIDLERNRIHIACGGDWQDSHNFWCDYVNNHFVADLSSLVLNAYYKEGMTEEQIHTALGI